MNVRLYKDGKLNKITTLKRNAILSKTDNPGAMFTREQITVINDENRTFSYEETIEIELLIQKEKQLC